jgi:hypothetical protein
MTWLVLAAFAASNALAFWLGLLCRVERAVNAEINRRLYPSPKIKRVSIGPNGPMIEYHP